MKYPIESDENEYKHALAKCQRVREWYDEWLVAMVNNPATESTLPEKRMRESVRPGLYEHWKSEFDTPAFVAVSGVHFYPWSAPQPPPFVGYTMLYGLWAGQLIPRPLFDEAEGFLAPMHKTSLDSREYLGPRFVLRRVLSNEKVGKLVDRAKDLSRIKSRASFLHRMREIVK